MRRGRTILRRLRLRRRPRVRTEPGTERLVDPVSLTATQRVLPSRVEPLVLRGSELVGGPLGRHALIGRHWFWTPLRVILLAVVLTLAGSWLAKSSCLETLEDENGVAILDWVNGHQYKAMCYSDTIGLYSTDGLDREGLDGLPVKAAQDGLFTTGEYPMLSGFFAWLHAQQTEWYLSLADHTPLPGALPVIVYFDISAFWMALLWVVAVWMLVRLCRGRPWDAALLALSPVLLVQAFTDVDVLAVTAALAGLLAWSRGRSGLAGVLLGAGAAARIFPALLLIPIVLLCVRTGRLRDAGRTVLGASGSWAAVNLPFALAYPDGWRDTVAGGLQRPADPDSLYHVFAEISGWSGLDGGTGLASAGLVAATVAAAVVVFAALAWVALAAPRRPRLAQLCFLVVAGFLLTGKVWEPQFSLWLVPLAVLALPRWRVLLFWMTVEALVWVPRMLWLLGTERDGLDEEWFLAALGLRSVVLLGLCGLVLVDIWRPERDLVRADGAVDDPHGGVLDRAADVTVLPTPRPPRALTRARETAVRYARARQPSFDRR